MKTLFFFFFLVGALSAQINTREEDSTKKYVLPEITISATLNEINVFDVPKDVKIISARHLKKFSPLSANDMMKTVPEVALQRTTAGSGSPILRGMIGRENLILIDGVRLNNSTYRSGPTQYFNTIDPASIERIELVYGPGSVLYGSDALGGVINIITKNPGNSNSFLSSSTTLSSSNDGIVQNLFAQSMWDGGGAFISTSLKKFNDLSAGNNINQSPTGYDELDGTIKLNFNSENNSSLSIFAQSVNQGNISRYDRIAAGKDFKNVYDPQQRHLFYTRYKKNSNSSLLHNYQIDVSLQRQVEGSNIIGMKNKNIEISERLNTLTGGVGVTFNSIFSNHILTYGLESYYDVISSSRDTLDHSKLVNSKGQSPFPPKSRYLTSALFTQDQYENDILVLIAGLRYSHFNFSASPETQIKNISVNSIDASSSGLCGSMNVSFKVIKNILNIYGGISQGFRAPNANDLSAIGLVSNFGVEVPNPGLHSEKSINYEAGIKANLSNISFYFSSYYMRLYDYIIREEVGSIDGTKIFMKSNAAEGELKGFNFSASFFPTTNLSLRSAVSYTIGDNLSGNEPLSKIPPLRGAISLNYDLPDYWFLTSIEFSLPQKRLSSNDISDSRIGEGGTAGYSVLDVRGGYKFAGWGDFVLSIENVFDKLYKIHGSGIYSSGRNFILSLNIDFK